jgi:uncharacterized membrane protein
MRKAVSITGGSLVAAVLTHGLVYSGMRLDGPLSPLSYRGMFQDAVLTIWNAWNFLHGWPIGRNHVEEFGRHCLAPFVLFVCPMIGFVLFTVIAKQKVGWQWWKPATIAAVLTAVSMLVQNPLRLLGVDLALAETARAVFVFILMVWSVGGIPLPKTRRLRSARSVATA